MTLTDELPALLGEASAITRGTPAGDEVERLAERLRGPLRVAIAGRVKAGKSTLLNALVGERLAPTDAGECTRYVTWYTYGDGYDVWFETIDGKPRRLPFTREEGRLAIDVSGIGEEPGRIRVAWPSARLKGLTLIDTPGLGSLMEGVSERTEGALTGRGSAPDADAVLYLMRHAHATDIGFLDAFLDDQLSQSTPINAIAVLSRADELGAGRPDAMQSASRVAARYAADPRIRSVASTVVPVVGLLAETAATLQEYEADLLRQLAREAIEVRAALLLSADGFLASDVGPVTVELRAELLRRFGLFGVRIALLAFAQGQWENGTQLAAFFRGASGVGPLQALLATRFADRSRPLVARTVVDGLRVVLEGVSESPEARALTRRLEELVAASHELSELEMLNLMWSGQAAFGADEIAEAERATGTGSAASRVGLDASASRGELMDATLKAVARWRERAGDVLADRQQSMCAETLARTYEGLYAQLAAGPA